MVTGPTYPTAVGTSDNPPATNGRAMIYFGWTKDETVPFGKEVWSMEVEF